MSEDIEVEVIDSQVDRERLEKVLDEQNKKHKKPDAQVRINELTRLRHEADRRARTFESENTRLKAELLASSKNAAGFAERGVEGEIQLAKRQLEEAHEKGDSKLTGEATMKLTEASARQAHIAQEKARLESVQLPQPAQAPQYSEKTQAFIDQNPWFTSDADMRDAALSFHNKVKTKHPIDSDEYFSEIGKRMRAAFPDYEWGDEEPDEEKAEEPRIKTAPATQKNLPGTGQPATKVRLTTEQIAMADSLGIPQERYALRVKNLRQQGILK